MKLDSDWRREIKIQERRKGRSQAIEGEEENWKLPQEKTETGSNWSQTGKEENEERKMTQTGGKEEKNPNTRREWKRRK